MFSNLNPLGSGHPLPIQTEVKRFDVEGSDEDDYFTMTISRNPEATDIAFIVEASDDLGESDPWSSVAVVLIEDSPGRLVVRDSVPSHENDRRFLRLRVER